MCSFALGLEALTEVPRHHHQLFWLYTPLLFLVSNVKMVQKESMLFKANPKEVATVLGSCYLTHGLDFLTLYQMRTQSY